ncbi:hypothetical protein BH09ACT11_BH09ACT11_18210 [soil metagenome]
MCPVASPPRVDSATPGRIASAVSGVIKHARGGAIGPERYDPLARRAREPGTASGGAVTSDALSMDQEDT